MSAVVNGVGELWVVYYITNPADCGVCFVCESNGTQLAQHVACW